MIARAKVKDIEDLVVEGRLSQRKIARLTGISRATVGAIAAGKRPDYDDRHRLRQLELAEEPLGPRERCSGCGGMVYMPCGLCRVRRIKDQEQAALKFYRREARKKALRRMLSAIRRASA